MDVPVLLKIRLVGLAGGEERKVDMISHCADLVYILPDCHTIKQEETLI